MGRTDPNVTAQLTDLFSQFTNLKLFLNVKKNFVKQTKLIIAFQKLFVTIFFFENCTKINLVDFTKFFQCTFWLCHKSVIGRIYGIKLLTFNIINQFLENTYGSQGIVRSSSS